MAMKIKHRSIFSIAVKGLSYNRINCEINYFSKCPSLMLITVLSHICSVLHIDIESHLTAAHWPTSYYQ